MGRFHPSVQSTLMELQNAIEDFKKRRPDEFLKRNIDEIANRLDTFSRFHGGSAEIDQNLQDAYNLINDPFYNKTQKCFTKETFTSIHKVSQKEKRHNDIVRKLAEHPRDIGLDEINTCHLGLPVFQMNDQIPIETFRVNEYSKNGINIFTYDCRISPNYKRFTEENPLEAEVDLVLVSPRVVVAAEYKLSKKIKNAQTQLEKAQTWMPKNYGISPVHLWHVSGKKYSIKELQEGKWIQKR